MIIKSIKNHFTISVNFLTFLNQHVRSFWQIYTISLRICTLCIVESSLCFEIYSHTPYFVFSVCCNLVALVVLGTHWSKLGVQTHEFLFIRFFSLKDNGTSIQRQIRTDPKNMLLIRNPQFFPIITKLGQNMLTPRKRWLFSIISKKLCLRKSIKNLWWKSWDIIPK